MGFKVTGGSTSTFHFLSSPLLLFLSSSSSLLFSRFSCSIVFSFAGHLLDFISVGTFWESFSDCRIRWREVLLAFSLEFLGQLSMVICLFLLPPLTKSWRSGNHDLRIETGRPYCVPQIPENARIMFI